MLWNDNTLKYKKSAALGQSNKLNYFTSFSKTNDYISSRDRDIIFATRITVSFQDKIKQGFLCTTLPLFF